MSTIKAELRKKYKDLRSSYNNKKSCENSFIRSDLYKNNNVFLIYASFGSEPETFDLIQKALDDKKTVYLPRVYKDTMTFYQIFNTEELVKGSFGIKEPVTGTVYDGSKAVCIVPGLAFDKSGNRLGYGKGYYDRFLCNNPNLIKVGFCAKCCFAEEIFTQSNDIPMNYIFVDDSIIGI
ncbi:MAG: 5-formyltetrahydrofolate cyclo-ligase [Clostridia bacterium]|nr:5-formyltetrahydrofolate cyclo-ligase [Clostridia bacterium]